MGVLFFKHQTFHCREIAAKSAKESSLNDEGVKFGPKEVLGRSEGPTVEYEPTRHLRETVTITAERADFFPR